MRESSKQKLEKDSYKKCFKYRGENVKSVFLNEDWLDRFKSYALAHGAEHDESYTSKQDIERFRLEDKNPTMLVVDDEEQEILGAASLIYHSYFLRGNRTRLRL